MAPSGESAVWQEWGRITRFFEGARLALAREVDLWTSLQIDQDVQLSVSTGQGRYKVGMHDHLDAMRDDETLFASVLIQSYALAESAAAAHLSLDSRTLYGIEDWGGRLLQAEGRDWGASWTAKPARLRSPLHGTRSRTEPDAWTPGMRSVRGRLVSPRSGVVIDSPWSTKSFRDTERDSGA